VQSYEKSSEKPNLFELFRGEDKSLADKLIEGHQKAIERSKKNRISPSFSNKKM
jgi:hypothetical protein